MFSSTIIDHIMAEWQKMPGTKKSPPVRDELQELLRIAFLVSLKREEEHPVRAQLMSLSQETASAMGLSSLITIVPFDSRYPLTVEWLAKTAPAFDPTTTAIAVARNEIDGKDFRAWGVVHTSNRGKSRFSDLSQWSPPPDTLAITAISPGSLVLSSGNRMVGRFINGEFSLAMPTPFSVKAMGKHLLAEIRCHQGYAQCDSSYWHYYRDLMELFLREASNRSHGATIVWVPHRAKDKIQGIVDARNSIESDLNVHGLLAKLCHLETEPKRDLNNLGNFAECLLTKRRVLDHIEFLAQLACVDGALILTDEMRPLSYGSMLRAKSWPGKVSTGPNGYDNQSEDVDLTRYGSRHNSAVAMAGACPDAVVFVVSQDGPVRGLKQVREDTVHWWPDCLTSVFLE